MKKILVIGAGAMGSAFCVPSLENKNDVTLIGTHLENQLIEELKKKDNFHPILQTKLPKELKIKKFSEMNEVLNNRPDIIVVGVSSLGIDWFIEQISKNFHDNQKIVLLTKGLSIFENKLITISEKIKILLDRKNFKNINISAVKGPCLAIGLANKIRTGVVIANPKIEEAEELSKVFSTDYYKAEISDDLNGVELSGAIKNIYSMLIGASEGLSAPNALEEIKSKYYLNTASSLFHRSISEMVSFVLHYGGKSDTVYGLAGLGDLYVSALGGRNSKMGKYLGQGFLYKDIIYDQMKGITVEGAELALELGNELRNELSGKKFPLMFNIIDAICNNQELKINW